MKFFFIQVGPAGHGLEGMGIEVGDSRILPGQQLVTFVKFDTPVVTVNHAEGDTLVFQIMMGDLDALRFKQVGGFRHENRPFILVRDSVIETVNRPEKFFCFFQISVKKIEKKVKNFFPVVRKVALIPLVWWLRSILHPGGITPLRPPLLPWYILKRQKDGWVEKADTL